MRDGRTVLSSLKGLDIPARDFPSVKTLGYFQEKNGAWVKASVDPRANAAEERMEF